MQLNQLANNDAQNSEPSFTPDKGRLAELFVSQRNDSQQHLQHIVQAEIEQNFISSARYMQKSGFHEGVTGIKTNGYEQIAASRSEMLYDFASSLLEGKISMLDTKIKAQNDDRKAKENIYKEKKKYLDYLEYFYQLFPRNFSVFSFVIYTISFLILFFTDIPLAIMTIMYGFDMTITSDPFALFQGGKFLQSVGDYWHIYLTAFGISLSTIYIKIAFDEFVGKTFGHKVMAQRKFIALFQKEDDETRMLSEKEINSIQKDDRRNKWVKFGILVFTVLSLVVLSFFRSDAWKVIYEIKKVSEITSTQFWAFLVLTLLFPLFGGVSLSYALTILQSLTHKKKAEKDCSNIYQILDESSQKLAQLQEEQSVVKKALEKWSNRDADIEKLTQIFVSYYKQGYNWGLAESDLDTKHLDFYDKINLWREKLIARKTNANFLSNVTYD